MNQSMKLELTQPGFFYTAGATPVISIIRWKVQTRDNHFYIIGFNIDRPGQKPRWQIVGRKDKHYTSADEALVALQSEYTC